MTVDGIVRPTYPSVLMSGRTLAGSVLLLFGLALLGEQLGVVDVGRLLSTWWPLLLVGVGGVKLITGTPIGGSVLLLAGLLFQARALEMLPGSFFDYFWPLVLVAGGVWLIASRGGGEPTTSTEDEIRHFVAFGGLETRNESQDFRGGSITAMFGGLELDLRGAKISGDRAVLETTTMLGGAEIRVPKEWRVVVSGTPLLGGWENTTEHRPDAEGRSPTLELTGLSILGGVSISN